MKKKVLMGQAKRLSLLAILAMATASAVFAQNVGDTVELGGHAYTVESVSGDRVTLVRAGQWVTDLPTNVNIAFQTTRVSAASRDGFLAPNGINPRNGTTIHLWDMNGNEPAMPHRLFKLVHLGEGWYQIRNNIHGILDIQNNRNENGLQMQLYEQNSSYNGDHQRFRIARVGDGLYQIYTSHGRNLHVESGRTSNGTRVVTWTGYHTDANQNAIWRIYTIDGQGILTQWIR